MKYWLVKSEGACYPIDSLKRDKVTSWEGVRSYQARNFMMNDMSVGDLVLFYHSMSTPSGVYGIARVASACHVDESQFIPPTAKEIADEMSHFDPKATREKPIWHCVDIAYVSSAITPLSLNLMKADPALEGMLVRAKGSRLSVQPVSKKHFAYIEKLLNEVI